MPPALAWLTDSCCWWPPRLASWGPYGHSDSVMICHLTDRKLENVGMLVHNEKEIGESLLLSLSPSEGSSIISHIL